MADGVDPRVALDVALPVSLPVSVPSLPPTMPSLPPDPSRAPYPLPQLIGAETSLRSLLRRDFEGGLPLVDALRARDVRRTRGHMVIVSARL